MDSKHAGSMAMNDSFYSLSLILVNRLVLNLHEVAAHDELGGSTMSAPVFASNAFLGSIGAPLHCGDSLDCEDARGTEDEYAHPLPETNNTAGITESRRSQSELCA